MRVLHICQRDDPASGGSLRVAEALCHEQKKAGIEVFLLFLYGCPAQMAENFSPNVFCLGLISSRQAFIGLWKFFQAIKYISPDIIHSHDGIFWPRLIYLFFRIPVVTHAHLSGGGGRKLKTRLGWWLVKKTTDGVIGISEHTVSTWITGGYPADKIRYIPNGVDFKRFSPVHADEKIKLRHKLGIPVDRQVIVWIGRLHRKMKGTDRIEHLAMTLPERTTLVVVGDGPEYKEIVTRHISLIHKGQLIMPGLTSVPEKYYQAADLFLFTSYYEPFGLVILEAVACELPILAFPVTNGGGAVKLLKEFKAIRIEDTASISGIQNAINAASKQKIFAPLLREEAKKIYSWSLASKKTNAFYVTLVESYGKSK